MTNNEDIFKKVTAHCKEYGFVFQSSEIYDGLAATARVVNLPWDPTNPLNGETPTIKDLSCHA